MKITVLTGSPHRQGTTALLTDEFIKGAESKGHIITRFDTAFMDIKPCVACDYCVAHQEECVQRDQMDEVRAAVLAADMIVLSTPVYYFGMNAQIKRTIDRFYAFNGTLLTQKKKSALLTACGDAEEWVPAATAANYASICRYLGWESQGMIVARGVYERSDIEKTGYPDEARRLGESL